MKRILCFLLALTPFLKVAAQTNPGTLFNSDWEFVKDIDTATSKDVLISKTDKTIRWEKVTLPHTPQIEPVIKVKEQWQGVCYYRKYFKYVALPPGSDQWKFLS